MVFRNWWNKTKKNQKSDISIHWGSGHPISEGNIVYWISQPQNTDNLKSGVYRYYCYAKVQCSARSGKTRFWRLSVRNTAWIIQKFSLNFPQIFRVSAVLPEKNARTGAGSNCRTFCYPAKEPGVYGKVLDMYVILSAGREQFMTKCIWQ